MRIHKALDHQGPFVRRRARDTDKDVSLMDLLGRLQAYREDRQESAGIGIGLFDLVNGGPELREELLGGSALPLVVCGLARDVGDGIDRGTEAYRRALDNASPLHSG
jgi:hypothetical protein